jgi:serine/threonine protein kinase
MHTVPLHSRCVCVLIYAHSGTVNYRYHNSMAAALAYMHHEADRDYAYIFRDLKPENCK